jgi:hypothetical protein
MQISLDHLLFLIHTVGAEKALASVNIESIEDLTVRIIARTLVNSCMELEAVVADRIQERDALVRVDN